MLGDRADRGLMYAEACFETLRVIGGQIFHWPAHLARLARAAEAFGWDAPAGPPLLAACLEAGTRFEGDALVRLTMSGGPAPWGLQRRVEPQIHIQAVPHAPSLNALHMQSVDWPFPVQARPAKFSADYAQSLRALVLWRRRGLLDEGTEALVCAEGRIIGGTSANVLLYREGVWLTPELGPWVLPGVLRQALIEAGVVRACSCPVAWLGDVEAMALTNAGSFIRPVAGIDRRVLDTEEGRFAPLWAALQGQPGVPA